MGARADTRVHGLAIGIESRVDHALQGSIRTGDPEFKIDGIGVTVEPEVAIHHRDQHGIPEGRLRALIAGFDLACRRTAVTAVGIAVVAVLAQVAEHDPIAAGRFARARAAIRLEGTEGGAAVAQIVVAIVAAFRALFDFVTTCGLVAGVIGRGTGARPARLPLTGARTAIAVLGVAVITAFIQQQDTVAALGNALGAREWAVITFLDLALVAAIARIVVGIVAGLGAGDDAVATLVHVDARLARRGTLVSRLYGLAIG